MITLERYTEPILLRNNPIPNVPTAEDVWWSRDKKVGCVPSAALSILIRDVHWHCLNENMPYKQLKMVGLSSQSKIGLRETFQGALHSTLQYGLKEGLRVTAQNLSRLAAHKL